MCRRLRCRQFPHQGREATHSTHLPGHTPHRGRGDTLRDIRREVTLNKEDTPSRYIDIPVSWMVLMVSGMGVKGFVCAAYWSSIFGLNTAQLSC